MIKNIDHNINCDHSFFLIDQIIHKKLDNIQIGQHQIIKLVFKITPVIDNIVAVQDNIFIIYQYNPLFFYCHRIIQILQFLFANFVVITLFHNLTR